MADITVTGAADFTKVTQGIKRIGAESDRVTKQSGRAGMAILDLSRGIEDFAVAGMRGATNNIPVLLQSLGAGAGLAGVATIALVGVNELAKGIDSMLEKFNEAREAKFNEPLFRIDGLQQGTKEVMDRVKSEMERGAASVRDFMQASREGDAIRENNAAISDLKAQEEAARRSLELLKQGKTEEEGRAEAIAQEIRLLQEKEKAQADSIAAARTAVAVTQEEIEAQTAVVNKYHEMRKAARATFHEKFKAAAEKRISPVGERTGRGSYIEKSFGQILEERSRNTTDAVRTFNMNFDPAALRNAEVAANLAAERVKLLREQMEVNKDALAVAERENQRKTQELKTVGEILKIEKERIDLLSLSSEEPKFLILPTMEEMRQLQALSEASRKQWEESVSKLRIDGTGMLSSSGRIGGSGKEFQASIATINYQREAINNLRKIERNTRNRTTSYK